MKKISKITLAIFAAGLLSVSNINAQSYDAGQMNINAGLSYGFDIEELGLRAGMGYFLNENMRIGGDITYWLIDSDVVYLEFNGNFNYIFYDEDELMFYGIGALGIHYWKFDWDMGDFGSGSESDTDLGLGLGAGGEYNLGAMALFGELKIFLSGFDQPKFNFGVRFYL